jgi:uracil phosphoribosyltransferase
VREEEVLRNFTTTPGLIVRVTPALMLRAPLMMYVLLAVVQVVLTVMFVVMVVSARAGVARVSKLNTNKHSAVNIFLIKIEKVLN